MKKILSSLLLTSATILMFGQNQVLVNENFESLTLGNVGTDVTGTTAGQGSMFLFGGTAADYQIASISVPNGKSLQVTSGNGAPPTTGANTNMRYVWKTISTTATPSNNIVVSKAKIYTGPSTGTGSIGLVIYGTTAGTSVGTIGGIKFNYATKMIQGEAYVTVATTPTPSAGVVTIGLGTQVFTPNTWIDVEHRYNKTSAQHQYFINGMLILSYTGGQVTLGGTTYTAATVAGSVPSESDIINTTAAANTVANVAGIDDWYVAFANTATLGTSDIKSISSLGIAIYPNPTSDILNIKTDSKITAVYIVDMTGRKVNVKLEGTQVDVRELPAGNYLINIETKDGISTEKFIKK